MIVVVEGPSAAGKTTCARQIGAGRFVAEHTGLAPPPAASSEDSSSFWTAANAARWQQALAVEAQGGNAVCDTDPLKLHYEFCLFRTGNLDRASLLAAVKNYRRAIARRQLGIADLVLCALPDATTLQRRKAGDRARQRRNFALHIRFAAPLAEWYAALEGLTPGRVQWNHPSELPRADDARDRYDLSLFDGWMAQLNLAS